VSSGSQTKTALEKPPTVTGLADLDAIIAAVTAGDKTAVKAGMQFVETKCTTAEGLGGAPKCAKNEPDGTPVEVFPFIGPGEGSYLRKADLQGWEGLPALKLYAVYRVSKAVYSDANNPAGEYALVFTGEPQDQTAFTLQVRQGKIVRKDTSLGNPPQIRPETVDKYLVPPKQ
jgi:hypothetical protein